jgi:CHASE2 domain-containing sensor protein
LKTLRPFLFSLAALAALAFSYFRVFDLYELQTYDWRCQFRGPRPVSSDIVFIDIWDDTLKQLGVWPFDRGYHADLIKILASAGARAVGMDILFVEPRQGDEAVAQAAKDAGNVYFVYAFSQPEFKKGRFVSQKLLAPLVESYEQSAKATGHVNASVDIDGKRRKVYPVIFHEGRAYPQLSLRIAMDLLGKKDLKELEIPRDERGFFLVNYAGKWEKTFRHYSYYDVIAAYLEQSAGVKPRIDLRQLEGKICFVGLTSLGSHDTSPVPIQSIYPMVGMHANVLNSILVRDFLWRLDRVWNLLILALFGGWVVGVALKRKPLVALLNTFLTLVFFTTAAVFCFFYWGVWVDLFYPLTLFVVLYAAATLGRMISEMRKRELIENELKIASQIQQSFLPAAVPQKPGLEIAAFIKPAKAVGGDLYHFIDLPEGCLGVMVGDVSGKGTPAALFMAKAVSEFKFSAREKNDPAQVLSSLNHSLSAEAAGGLFVTLTYVILDQRNRRMVFSSGGHLPILWARRSGNSELLAGEGGMPLGVIDGVEFSNTAVEVAEGDCLVLYSDGISEARNRRKQEYGIETLQKWISKNRHLRAEEMVRRTVSELGRFMGKADQHDDMTLLVIKVGLGE